MAETKKLVMSVRIAAKAEDVFRELTRTDRPLGAIFNARLTTPGLARGTPMQMRTPSGRHALIAGEVLEYDPPRRFAHTHRFTRYDDPLCRVVYDLRPVGNEVEVTLTVEELAAGTRSAKDMERGAGFILANLKAIVETGRPTGAARAMYAMFGLLEFLLPARTRSERWPMHAPGEGRAAAKGL